MTWNRRTAWEVRERGESGEGNFMLRRLLVGLKKGFLGLFCGDFSDGVVEVSVVVVEIVQQLRHLWWWLMSFLFCRGVELGVNFFSFDFPNAPPPLYIWRCVHFLFSRCVFLIFSFFLIFKQLMEVEMEVEQMLLVQLVLVLSLLFFGLLFLLLLLLLLLLLVLFCGSVFFPFWSPQSPLLRVCLGGPQVRGQDWWLGRWFFLGYCCWRCYCWCCCSCWWSTSMGRFLINDLVVCRTSSLTSCPPQPPSSAVPYRLVCSGWPGSLPY